MKTKTHIYILFILFVLFSCKKTNNINEVNKKNDVAKVIDSVKKKIQHDIYINNLFNGMTELVDVKTVEFEETCIDSIWYGLYNIRNTDVYIFAVDKYLENPDIEQYKTIDTVNLNSQNIEVKVENFSDYKTLNLSVDKNFVKKWKFKTYPKKEQDNINIISKKTSIFNSWINNENYIPEIRITNRSISYLFHGQCVYFFPIKIVNENEVELIWGQTGRDCVYEVFFDETFDLPKNKIPQKGKPFAKYKVDNEDLKVIYFYKEWVEKYKNKLTEDDKPFPFLNSFILKKE